MKKTVRFLPAVLLLVLLAGCTNPFSRIQESENAVGSNGSSRGTLAVVLQQSARTLVPDADLDAVTYRLLLSAEGQDDIEKVFAAGQQIELSLSPADYSMVLIAENSAGLHISAGEAEFTISSGLRTSVALVLAYIQGGGDLQLDVTWGYSAPEGAELYVTLALLGGDPVEFPVLSVDARSFATVAETLPGGYYTITARLMHDGEQLSGGMETALVLTDTVTAGQLLLGGDYAPDPDPVVEPLFPDFLGAVYRSENTTFRIWSPDHTNVRVRLDGVEHDLSRRSDFNGYTDVYEVIVPGDHKHKEYTFVLNGVDVRDPYGFMVVPNENINIIMDLTSVEPEGGWVGAPPLDHRTDTIIYEAHIRDFTQHESWTGNDENRGRYLGMVEPDTSYAGEATGLDHLKELGVTHIQIMPFYDFATQQYNWGYDPKNWNVPEEQYSAVYAQDPTDYEGRIREVMTMINEFHRHGFRVIMDVVYNHTYGDEQFEDISTRYYTGNNDSGTGNGIDTSVPMVSRTIQDSQEFWVEVYNLDGFRHDLMGVFHSNEVRTWGNYLNNVRFPDRNLVVFGEPWNGYYTDPDEGQKLRYGNVHQLADVHVGVFNGGYREAIKGQSDDPGNAYMFNDFNHHQVDGGWAIYDGMQGSPYEAGGPHSDSTWGRNYAAAPEQAVNYISAHDNFGLWDRVYIGLAGNVVQNESKQVMSFTPPGDLVYAERIARFGIGMIFTSQGIAFTHAGDEMLRTKTRDANISNPDAWRHGEHGGTHNTYNSPDSFNMIRWGWKADNRDTFDYFRDLIAIRNNHPGLRMRSNADIEQYMTVNRPDDFGGQVVTGHIQYPNDSHNLFVVYNSGNNQTLQLPGGEWTMIADAGGAAHTGGLSGNHTFEGTAVTVLSQSR